MAGAWPAVTSRPTVVTVVEVLSTYVARSSRTQPTGARTRCRSGSKAPPQPAGRATPIRVQDRSAPPGPPAFSVYAGGKSWSTGVFRQMFRAVAKAATLRSATGSGSRGPWLMTAPAVAPPIRPRPSTRQSAARTRRPSRDGASCAAKAGGGSAPGMSGAGGAGLNGGTGGAA